MKLKTLLDLTLKESRDLAIRLRADNEAEKFITSPREYLSSLGILVPSDNSIQYTPTEELQARFVSESQRKKYIRHLEEADALKTLHLVGGRYHCGYVECDCGDASRIAPPPPMDDCKSRNIYTDLTHLEFYNIVNEANKDKNKYKKLRENPQAYFESIGFYSPSPNLVRFGVIHTSDVDEQIQSRKGFDDRFKDALVWCHVHVRGGDGNCDYIWIDCPAM